MTEFLKKTKEYWGLAGVVVFQLIIYTRHITEPFIDGRFHINWGPPFWLMKAQLMHQVNFLKAYLGAVATVAVQGGETVATGAYTSHPQFVAIPLYIWTGLFGFSEIVIRTLPLLFFCAATVLWWYAWRVRHTAHEATLFVGAVAILPVMISFATKLDQEPFVWFFVALAAFGYERFMAGNTNKPIMWMIGIIGMMWSDWSGFIFGALCGAALLYAGRTHARSKQLMWYTLCAGLIGAAIVFLQTMLQTWGNEGIIKGFQSLYKYRSNSTQPGFWSMWFTKQRAFFTLNFSGLLGLVGLIVVVIAMVQKSARSMFKKNGFSLLQYTGIIALGTLLYARVVPQATAIHIYYQMFYGACIGAGLMIVALWLHKKSPRYFFVVAILTTVIGSTWYGIYRANESARQGFGTPDDMELFKRLHPLSATTTVHALTEPSLDAWLDNPNIVYYSGRRIVAVVQEKILEDEYLVTINEHMSEKNKLLHELAKGQFLYEQLACSTNFCILRRNPNPDYGKTKRK